MSLLRKRRTSPRAARVPRVVERGPIERSRIDEKAHVGPVGQSLDEGEGLGVGGPVVDQDQLDAGVHRGGGGDGVHAGAEEPWLVAKRDQDAHEGPGLDGPQDAETAGGRARRHPLGVMAPPQDLLNVANGGRAGLPVLRPRPVAEDLGYVRDRLRRLGGGECAFVLERSRAGAHQAGQAVGHGGPDGQRATDIGGGQEELGRVVGLEAGGVRGPVGTDIVLVRVDDAPRRERSAQQGHRVGRPEVAGEDQCTRRAAGRVEALREEVTVRGVRRGPQDPAAPAVPQGRRGADERAHLVEAPPGCDGGQGPAAGRLRAHALERAADGGRLVVADDHDQAQCRLAGRSCRPGPLLLAAGAPTPRRDPDPG